MSKFRFRFSFFMTLLLVLSITLPAMAQTTTATIRGKVIDESGNPVPSAEINAVNSNTGFVKTVTARADGTFVLPGLVPGPYNIVVASPTHQPVSKELTVLVGQTLNMEFSLTPAVVVSETVTVIGNVPVEMHSAEIKTNVTEAQIDNLPQGDRNFLNFASLAPGVRLSTDPFKKTFSAGAQNANAVNVFVDGVTFKNDVLQGGVVGQDSSRGNPFPQNAVQEFRVLTQNYSAEFQKSSSAVITAVTKSGTNNLKGEVFGFYQDKDLVARDPFSAPGTPKPAYERLQTGLDIGGPIIRDKMHFFFSYEGNNEDRQNRVSLGGSGPPEFRQQFLQYEGVFTSPFDQRLFFGKVSYQPTGKQLLDFSGYVRDETDVRGFGGQTSFQSAEKIVNDIWQAGVRHQYTGNDWLNEASLSYQDFKWNPQPENASIIGKNYFGIIRIGGRDTEQNFEQKRTSLRDDFTTSAFEWHGNHLLKTGGTVDFLNYDVFKAFTNNPVFNFRSDENWAFPFEARYGLGDPNLSGDNTEIGIYGQDEWSVNDHLILNIGLRWDYESDMFPTDYVTPQVIRDNFQPILRQRLGQSVADNYFTDGNDRSAIDDMFAPRFGFSYDVGANSRTVIYGGWGRYYDRILYNNSLDERFRLQYSVGVFAFSTDGAPRNGLPTVVWKPEYLSISGLQQLLAEGRTGNPEVFLIENDTKAPYSDQWNIGVRQRLGQFIASLAYGNVRSYNGFSFIFGNRRDDGTCCVQLVPGYSNVLLSTDDIKTWYDSVYFTLDRPFTSNSIWSATLAYTYNDAKQIGGDLFSLDFPRIQDYPKYPVQSVPDHEAVATALFRLPWQMTFGTILSYNSGVRYTINDNSQGSGPNERRLLRNGGEEDEDTLLNLRLEKAFTIFGDLSVAVIGEVFNVFDDKLYTNYDGFIPVLPQTNASFGKPRAVLSGSGRRFQYGVRVRF